MKQNEGSINTIDGIIVHPKNEIARTKKTWLEKDIILNVGFKESMIRCIASLFLPWPFMLLDHRLFIAVTIIMFYFFVTGLLHFCPVRYAWWYWIRHKADPEICDFAKDLQVPVKTI